MENNDYYEPTIKTSRNDKQFQKDVLNVTGNIVKTSLNCIEKQHNELEKLEKEKQQLISFLKDLIEETECAYDYKENDYKNSGKWNLLNEILDFVNKGSKDE